MDGKDKEQSKARGDARLMRPGRAQGVEGSVPEEMVNTWLPFSLAFFVATNNWPRAWAAHTIIR